MFMFHFLSITVVCHTKRRNIEVDECALLSKKSGKVGKEIEYHHIMLLKVICNMTENYMSNMYPREGEKKKI